MALAAARNEPEDDVVADDEVGDTRADLDDLARPLMTAYDRHR